MKLACKLALSYAVQHPLRMLLTALAMVASACIVVWVVSGYDALAAQFGEQAEGYLGRYDFFVVPEDPNAPYIDAALVDALRRDPEVAEATAAAQVDVRVLNPEAGPGGFAGPGGPSLSAAPGGRGGPGMRGGPGAREMPDGRGGPNARGMRGPGARDGTAPKEVAAERSADAPPTDPRNQDSQSGPSDRGRSRGPGGPGGGRGPGLFGFGAMPRLVGTDAAEPPQALTAGAWIDPAHPERRGAVLGENAAEQLQLKVGDDALVIYGTKEYRIHVVGLIKDGPSQMGMGRRMRSPTSTVPRTGIEAGPASSALFVPLALADHFARGAARVNLINIQLKPEAKARLAQFRETWESRIAQTQPTASLMGVGDIRTNIEEGMMASRARQEAWAATGLSLLAALFIIFTTLSMGVAERVRQFAILRAVGLTRLQVAQVIAVEAVLLALIGWGGGLIAGWGLLAIMAWMKTGLFDNGESLGAWCIIFTGISALGGALAASILPAWRAMGVQPLEAMSPQRFPRPRRTWAVVSGIAALALIAVNPILVFAAPPSMSSDTLYGIYMAVGCTTMAVGFLLLTPATILVVEAVLGPVLARLLGLEPRLLRAQLGSNLWRTLGTTAALTVGLGLFVAMQIWGYSMLQPFTPGDWVPDLLVSFQRGGLPDSEIAAVRAIEGVRADRCVPLAVEQPKLATDITGSEQHSSVIRQDNVIMIGLDPQVAFGGADPLIKARFVAGDPATAIARLKEGRNCIVPDHFLRATNLKLGDSFSMVLPDSPSKRVPYTIVGAVSLPGWHWMTKFSGLRRREGRSAAIVFADYDRVRSDFELRQINFLWMNVDEEVGRRSMAEARELLDERARAAAARPAGDIPPMRNIDEPLTPKLAAVMKIGAALETIADRNQGAQQPVNMQGQWPIGARMFGDSARLSTPDQVRAMIATRASGMIWASCYLPLITLAVTSLGVVNTVMASVRARRWEFGVLRSQGVTRSGLFRMILAEGLMIGLITCLLSLSFGVFSGWCGTGISQYVSFFGGLAPPLVIPWAQLSIGFGMAMGLCLAAALWPAIATGRAEPLRLLQEGRAAM